MSGVKNFCRRLLWSGGMAAVIFMVFLFARSSTAIAITHTNEYISTDTTWYAADNPHIIAGYVIVDASSSGVVTLTIEPGCVLKFNTGASLQIGQYYSSSDGTKGALKAQGTVANPIIFDARYATWYSILFLDDSDDATSIMDYCNIEDVRQGIQCYNASPTIQNCTIKNFLYYGIYCFSGSSPIIHYCTIDNGENYGIYCESGSSPSIQHCTISNIVSYGIYAGGTPIIKYCTISNIDNSGIYIPYDVPNISNNTISECGQYGINSYTTSSTAVISNNVCSNNGLYPIALHPMGVISTGNSGSGNGTDAILINSGSVDSNTTWVDQETGFDYVIDGAIWVDAYTPGDVAILTIAPGFTVKFGSGASIQIGYYYWYWSGGEGALSAVGTDINPITFTSKQGSPAPGDWSGVYFNDETRDAETILEHCRIEYASYGAHCNNASPSIRCSEIKDNYYGVVSYGGTDNPSIQNCNITGNVSYGVVNWGNTTAIDAKNNWWGDASGPDDDGGGACTASGTGDKVNCYVDYASWKVAQHTCTASSTAIKLASFTAAANDNGVVILDWETATEVDNAGFNIYCSKRKDGMYKKVNNTLIASKGNEVSGASYRFEDMPGHGAFYYKLEDVDDNGNTTLHGPEKVRVKSGNNGSRRSRNARR
ncbi:MAG: right-handed parallel beta-helix repeat-containing protein [Candidatus Brocadia sp.]|nr:right-handed parallel beta-helix repeat-containing protein [Candidatus Brocadia sp.]